MVNLLSLNKDVKSFLQKYIFGTSIHKYAEKRNQSFFILSNFPWLIINLINYFKTILHMIVG